MRRWSSVLLLFSFLALPAVWVCAQEATPSGPAQELLGAWNREGKKLIDMAEDFPEDKYDYRPTPEVRSFAEHLLHVAGGNRLFLAVAQGQKPPEEELTRENYKTKAEVVAVLKKSIEDGAAYIQQQGDAGMTKPVKHPFANRVMSQYGFWMGVVVSSGEHYGSLVVYYRLNGLVPPVSRRRPG